MLRSGYKALILQMNGGVRGGLCRERRLKAQVGRSTAPSSIAEAVVHARCVPTGLRPLRPPPANEAVLESGRHAGVTLSATICERAPRSDPVALNILNAIRRHAIRRRSPVRSTFTSYKRIIAACPLVPGALEWTTVPRMIASGATAPWNVKTPERLGLLTLVI